MGQEWEVTTKDEFKRHLAESERVAVLFLADWSGPCRMIKPYFRIESEKYSSRSEEPVENPILFIVVDNAAIGEVEDLERMYDISAYPTFKFIKNKEVVSSFTGASRDKMKLHLEALCQMS